MGRHSLDSAHPASSPAPSPRDAAAPVTDPVLLDAVERELRRLRVEAASTAPAPHATRRVETPFSGPVDVPEENVIGPHRPITPQPLVPLPTAANAPAPRTAVARPSEPQGSSVHRSAPRPVAARPAASRSTGPVIVPTHRPAPVPVEAPRDLEADEADEAEAPSAPVGLSTRTLLLSAGIGLLASTALSLLALLPR